MKAFHKPAKEVTEELKPNPEAMANDQMQQKQPPRGFGMRTPVYALWDQGLVSIMLV